LLFLFVLYLTWNEIFTANLKVVKQTFQFFDNKKTKRTFNFIGS
jgi:hypothetical protein